MRHDGASPAEAPVASARSCLSSTAGPGLLPSGPRAHDHSPGAARGSGILRQLARALAPSVDSARARYWSCIQMSRGRPVSTQSPRDMGSAVRPSCGLGGATSSASLASPRRTPLHASGRSDRNRLGADDHPRAGDEIHPGPKEIRGEVFFPSGRLRVGVLRDAPLHLPREADSGKLVSWEIHPSIGNGAILGVGTRVRKQWRLPVRRNARDPRRRCGDSGVRPVVPLPWTGSPTGRHLRSGRTGLSGRRPSRRGATPIRRSLWAESHDWTVGAVVPAALVWSAVGIVRPLI